MLFYKTHSKRPYESIVPLINVVFLLMIFFMVAGQLKDYEVFPTEPPTLQHNPLNETSPPTLLIDSEGKMALNNESIQLDELGEQLSRYSFSDQALFTIKADKNLSAQQFVLLLSELKPLGLEKINFITINS